MYLLTPVLKISRRLFLVEILSGTLFRKRLYLNHHNLLSLEISSTQKPVFTSSSVKIDVKFRCTYFLATVSKAQFSYNV